MIQSLFGYTGLYITLLFIYCSNSIPTKELLFYIKFGFFFFFFGLDILHKLMLSSLFLRKFLKCSIKKLFQRKNMYLLTGLCPVVIVLSEDNYI